MTERERLRIMTEEEMQEERQQLEERAEWEWEGRRPQLSAAAENDAYRA